MPAPIIDGLITFLSQAQQLNASIWDGEVPRYDANQQPISPDSTIPTNWPVIKLTISDHGFDGEFTFEDPYDDVGTITIKVWSTSRATTENLLTTIEAALCLSANWAAITAILGGLAQNPYAIVHIIRTRWTSVQEADKRTAKSELLYRGELDFEVMIHGAVAT